MSAAKSPTSQAKKDKPIGTRDGPSLNQSHGNGKVGQLSIGVENRDMDINELLRLTEKSGIMSTRHRNPDFLTKLENEAPRRQESFVYRAMPEKAQLELNSPKYQTQMLSDIMNLTKTHSEQNDKMKKLRVVKANEAVATASRKDPSKHTVTNRVKPASVRSSLQMPQTSSRDAKSTVQLDLSRR
jgi:hypothetical protein